MIALDANVLIAAFNSKDAHHDWAITFIRDTAAEDFVISALNYAEILVNPTRHGVLSEFRKSIDSLGYEIAPISPEDAVDIAQVRSETGLRMPDAVVIHTAHAHSASLATTDSQVARIATERGITVYCP